MSFDNLTSTELAERDAEWEAWLATRPPEVAKVARRVVPWKRWALTTHPDSVSYYVPTSYQSHKDGSVTVTAVRFTHDGEALWQVFGLSADDFVEYPYSDINPPPLERIATEGLMVAAAEAELRSRG
ncbi:MAG: hypothetical protein QOI98_3131 [Solirubrobacteraceae bacterium]|nr:hypothetical protein [Solirubrobacteraceae bacterium]